MRAPLLCAVIVLGAASTTTATDNAPASASAAPQPARENRTHAPGSWLDWTTASGTWKGVRDDLEARGVTLRLSTISDVSRVRSMTSRVADIGRTLFDGRATLDLGTLWGWKGTTASVEYYAKAGGNGASCAGNDQGVSNIDADSFHKVGEAWIESWVVPDRLRVKVGRVDANTEFAAVEAASDFVNPSMGYSPTILLFPTYPDPRLSMNVAYDPSPRFGVSTGVYDGTAAGDASSGAGRNVFVVTEVRAAWTASAARLPGRIGLGAWRRTGRLARLDDPTVTESVAAGPFFTLEQTVWRETASPAAARQVRVFLQYGRGNPALSAIDRHVGLGMSWRGAFGPRREDVLGVGLTRVHLSRELADRRGDDDETALVGSYQYVAASWLALQPDVQYVVHPAGGAPRHAAFAATLRVRVQF